mgnify:CR=1 FL=1
MENNNREISQLLEQKALNILESYSGANNYLLRLKRQQELNKFNTLVLKNFQSRQAYTIVNGHYIPIVLEDTSDESQVTDLTNKRFYIQLYTFNLQGFILDPNDFIVTPAISRTLTITENG